LATEHGEHKSEDEDDGSMTVITEHYSEEEGEGHDSERSGVGFTVGRDTVHVGDLLEGSDEVVGPEVSGRVKLRDATRVLS